MKYLASPYTHPDSAVMEARFLEVCKIAAILINKGNVIFCPIAMAHPIKLTSDLPHSWQYWEKFDTEFILASDELLVAMMDGWETSIGVQAEIKIAEKYGIQVSYIDISRLK